ncbi:MAG: xanthine dehydrogenase family protein molybdopterin-binding subunit [Defluviicoccus sp.]|nr:xanthine dehydrogenase family protein molybdopterin-binding subunit [Defluviicoccus sp.]MDE0274720.1 xanthine dehydrogenase family protein molybdopterin-binding subunit [Defluviicoccus sp.]
MGEFGVGQPVPRLEDPALLTGRGLFADDAGPGFEGALRGYVLRSPHANARFAEIDVSEAAAVPGVAAVLTARDYIADGLGPIPHIGPPVERRGGGAPASPPYYPLADGHARHVGDGVAFIVADTLESAKDAAERIAVDYEPLPSVTGTAELLENGAPAVFDGCPDNECFVHEIGDRAATDAAFAGARNVVRRRFLLSRVLANAIEPRGCVADYDPRARRLSLRAPVQHPFVVRGLLANRVFGVDEQSIHVEVDDVGGSFGIKANVYPEYLLSLWAARRLGRPVRWASERSEGHLSDFHGRDNVTDAELALDADNRFVGLRVRTVVNLGAYLSPLGAGPAVNNLGSLAGVYRTPAAHVEVRGALSNSQPTAPYRGAGRPEAAFVIERLIDAAAEDLGVDRVELRRRNIIGSEELPFATPLGFVYDSGDFETNMDRALSLAEADRFERRRKDAAGNGKLLGLGVANAIERAAPPGLEFAEIRFAPSGRATVLCGATTQGQGHATTFAQLLSDRLGLDPEEIRFVQGDTDRLAFGFGAGGSRISAMGCAALLIAADKVVDKGKRIAAHVLEAAVDDIEFADGRFAIAGTDRTIALSDVAKTTFQPARLPGDIEPGLIETGTYRSHVASYPNGCHVCEVEIDRETGEARILRYVVVDDFGTVINPLLVEGQVHGGVAQGAGQALMERMVFDRDSGQMLAGSLMDYAMPRSDDLCFFEVESNPVPTVANPLGVKGAGEAGTVGALPAVISAVNDALRPLGAGEIEMPATPERIWRAVRSAPA